LQHYIQTVYLPQAMAMPDWADEMVVYYIFPDRFKNGNKANDPQVGIRPFYDDKPIEFHENWNDPKPWMPGAMDGNTEDDEEWNNDFYGGDLEGIIAKLDHIASLGANVLYINPIFYAPSNHKYDTADYMRVDPAFGDLATFRRLAAEAKDRGIRIILDASLNHSGSDSVYMDRFGKYDTLGAFENETVTPQSPYFDWYEFTGASDPDQAYRQWANPSLANLQESDSWKDFAFRNRDSVTKFWLDQGAAGWRMDVVPWVSDEFWMEWRQSLNETHPEAITFAEVWFDASKYLYGDKFHSTMNYIFRGALLDLANQRPVEEFVQALEMMQENYPPQVFRRLMNLVSSHDVPGLSLRSGSRIMGSRVTRRSRSDTSSSPLCSSLCPGLPRSIMGMKSVSPVGRIPFPGVPSLGSRMAGITGIGASWVTSKSLGDSGRSIRPPLFTGI
jgi:cyclomaltodextrinase